MKYIKFLLISVFIFFSCKDNDDTIDDNQMNLSSYLSDQAFELGAVIACAASQESTNDILTFYYPENGATDIRFYETLNIDVDNSDFLEYKQVFIESEPFFNGYLGKFTQSDVIEKWIIITYKLNNEIKISNPIRTKQSSKPTLWTNEVTVDQTVPQMPNFNWEDNAAVDNTIYFQVISDSENNLLSGTYTFENNFQYYDTSNVVLNITTETPPDLTIGSEYTFTLMDVSEDNWVNLVIQNTFEVQ